MKQTCTTYAVILQVVAILLLPWHQLAPQLGRERAPLVCSGDHQLCGCSPERVAAHTCCCSQQQPACCASQAHPGKDRLAKGEGKPASPSLSIAPCGDAAKFTVTSLDQLKFVPAAAWPVIAVRYTQVFPSPFGATVASRFPEPPDPPPQLLSLS